MLGVPILLALFGHAVLLPCAIVIIFITFLSYVPSNIILSWCHKKTGQHALNSGLGLGVYLSWGHQMMWMPILAIICSTLGWHSFYQLTQYLIYLQYAVVPCALFAAGLSIASLSSEKGMWRYVINISLVNQTDGDAIISVTIGSLFWFAA